MRIITILLFSFAVVVLEIGSKVDSEVLKWKGCTDNYVGCQNGSVSVCKKCAKSCLQHANAAGEIDAEDFKFRWRFSKLEPLIRAAALRCERAVGDCWGSTLCEVCDACTKICKTASAAFSDLPRDPYKLFADTCDGTFCDEKRSIPKKS